jgi:hypothetical protein
MILYGHGNIEDNKIFEIYWLNIQTKLMASVASIVRKIADDLLRYTETNEWSDAVETAVEFLSQKSLDEIRQLSEFGVEKIASDITGSDNPIHDNRALCVAVDTIMMRVCVL